MKLKLKFLHYMAKNKFDLKLEQLRRDNLKISNNEYKKMLEKCMIEYYKIKWGKSKKKIYFAFVSFSTLFVTFQIMKYYYVIYYYIMWEVDIRKPRVSDYIVERFR